MSLLGNNIIPGEHGKLFTTDAKLDDNLFDIHEFLVNYKGVERVEIDKKKFPVTIKIYANKIIDVGELKKQFQKTGFHLVDENLFR